MGAIRLLFQRKSAQRKSSSTGLVALQLLLFLKEVSSDVDAPMFYPYGMVFHWKPPLGHLVPYFF